MAPLLSLVSKQSWTVERITDGNHHPAHRVLSDVEAIAEIVSGPKMVEDVAAGSVECGVGFGHGSPGCGDALLQHARHPVAYPARGRHAIHPGVRIDRSTNG